MSVMRVE